MSDLDTYELATSRVRIRIGVSLVMGVLALMMGYVTYRVVAWEFSWSDVALLGLMVAVVGAAGLSMIRAHMASFQTVLTKSGISQGVGSRERFYPWEEISKVEVSNGILRYPDFELKTTDGKLLFIRGFYYEDPMKLWATLRRHAWVIDKT